LVDNHHSLILFTNDDRVGSIISGLPEHIAVRQLASQPEGIVQDEANVAFFVSKGRVIAFFLGSQQLRE
jgi:hypothetical protein